MQRKKPPAGASPPDEPSVLEYDAWRWHVEGVFPKDQLPEQGYVHIGMFLAWLANRDMLDPDWVAKAGLERAVAAIRERRESACGLRDMTDGRLSSDMLTREGRAFTGAYYAPEYGYASDWQKVFGRQARNYAVPDEWETYDRIAPVLERRHSQWVDAGRPELMPLSRPLTWLLNFARSRQR